MKVDIKITVTIGSESHRRCIKFLNELQAIKEKKRSNVEKTAKALIDAKNKKGVKPIDNGNGFIEKAIKRNARKYP